MGRKTSIGVWVVGKNGAIGWLEDSYGVPTRFDSFLEAKEWIKNHTVHKEYYEAKIIAPIRSKIKKEQQDMNNDGI